MDSQGHRGMPLHSTGRRTAVVVAAVAGVAGLTEPLLGQGVTYRTFLTTAGPGPRLPAPYVGFSVAAMLDHDHVLAKSGASGVFECDGVTCRRIMVPGRQIPGQPPRVVWAGSILTDVWPLAAGGAMIWAAVSGPGYEGFEVPMLGPVEAPSLVLPQGSAPGWVTPTGLTATFLDGQGLAVGPVGGPYTVVLPDRFVVPGRTSPGTSGPTAYLGSDGVMSLSLRTGAMLDCLVAGPEGVRVVVRGDSEVESDRGPLDVRYSAWPASQPLPDGSVYVVCPTVRMRGTFQECLFRAHQSGPAEVVAMTGEPAPGLGPGYTVRVLNPLAASRAGSLLFEAIVEGPNDGLGTAIYLWRRGLLTLVARSGQGRRIVFHSSLQAAGLNDHDEVGLIVDAGAILFRPGVGTVTALECGRPYPGAGPVGTVAAVYPYFGSSMVRRWSGGDDASINPISEDGRLMVCCNVEGASGGAVVLTVQMDDRGCPVDFDNDGFVGFEDYADFVECFEGGACPEGRTPDFNGDDFGDFFDYADFVAAFEAGC